MSMHAGIELQVVTSVMDGTPLAVRQLWRDARSLTHWVVVVVLCYLCVTMMTFYYMIYV